MTSRASSIDEHRLAEPHPTVLLTSTDPRTRSATPTRHCAERTPFTPTTPFIGSVLADRHGRCAGA